MILLDKEKHIRSVKSGLISQKVSRRPRQTFTVLAKTEMQSLAETMRDLLA